MKPGPKRVPPLTQFEERTLKTDTCWLWTGKKTTLGYGQLRLDEDKKRYVYAHRFSYEHHKGPIQTGLFILHSCDNPSCVNPAHLTEGTKRDNSLDMADKGRQGKQGRAHCQKGHALSGDNIKIVARRGREYRYCLTCYTATCTARTLRHAESTRLRNIEYRRKKKEGAALP